MRNLKYILFFLIAVLSISCSVKECNCPYDAQVQAESDSFINVILADTSFSSLRNYFDRMKVPPLDTLKEASFQLFINPTLLPYHKLYHLEKDETGQRLISKLVKTKRKAYKPDQYEEHEKRIELSTSKWKALNAIIDNQCFWSTATNDERQVLDGTSLVMQGRKLEPNNCTNRTYHLVGRVGPDSSAFQIVVDHIVSLDPFNIDSLEEDFH